MRKSCSTGIIFTGILLVGLITGCNNQDKTKEKIPNKKVVQDILKDTLQGQEIITKEKKAISNKNIKPKDEEQQKRLPKVVLIITSQACDCTLERCAKGEKIVNELVQQFSKKLTFEKIDHAREEALGTQLAKEYQLHYLPALLFFDKKGTFNGKLEGFLNKGEIEKKLKVIGVK